MHETGTDLPVSGSSGNGLAGRRPPHGPKINGVSTASEPGLDPPPLIWRARGWAFALDWSAAVLEEIRQAAVEAFFSLPHGGVEIGGVLFGTREGERVRVLAARALACEHAFGPSFTLSERDHEGLRGLLDEGGRDAGTRDLEAVGWYHSHTRSGIFLSTQDLEIHNRYFPDPQQVALVVRPHAMRPVRAGFFFREADGAINAESSHGEFVLTATAPAEAEAEAAVSDTEPAPEGTPSRCGPEPPLPAFLSPPARKYGREWFWWAALVLAVGGGMFAFKDSWLPAFSREPATPALLMTFDLDGQLQIRWDRAAEVVRSASGGTLEITDGTAKTLVALDRKRLQEGTFSYARQTPRVDIRLALDQPDGRKQEELTSFLGQAPAPKPSADSTAADRAKLRQELEDQAARTLQLKRAIDEMQAELLKEQVRQQKK